jgi:adenylate kinase family enzyme
MARILIFGNSGAGKSTLARALATRLHVAHLDLDSLAWLAEFPMQRRPLAQSEAAIRTFTSTHSGWVIEGCYADLLQSVSGTCSLMLFLNPGIETCVQNCRARSWEPHKYPSKEAQDKNLYMLIDWVRDYAARDDEFSLQRHRALFDTHPGNKRELTAAPIDASTLELR